MKKTLLLQTTLNYINMKKLILSLVILVMAASLTAQVSVWDGSYEELDISNGKGETEDNPILIENAAQLAHFSTLFFCNDDYEYKYYRLTTDVDLNNMEWQSIGGANPAISCDGFYGYFDGDNHTIYKLTSPLFHNCYGYIKNVTVKESTINESGTIWMGVIAVHGTNDMGIIENCHNYADINVELEPDFMQVSDIYIGGIVGTETIIRNCTNHGNIHISGTNENGILHVGGITGDYGAGDELFSSHNYGDIVINDCEINEALVGGISAKAYNMSCCSNHGNIDVDITITDANSADYAIKCGGISGTTIYKGMRISYCYNNGDVSVNVNGDTERKAVCGGIIGNSRYGTSDDATEISNCYNTGLVSANNNNGSSFAGGIVGIAESNQEDELTDLKITSCYNAANLDAKTTAGIIAMVEENTIAEADNCFMADYNDNGGYGETLSTDFMKTDEFVAMLNKYGKFFKKDVEPFANDGYPVLDYSSVNAVISVDETSEINIEIYPNPARDFIKLSAVSGQLSAVRVYNTLGMLVEEFEMQSNEIEINVSDYKSGLYFINISTDNGDTFTEKVVVR